jgi:hypothetical protein
MEVLESHDFAGNQSELNLLAGNRRWTPESSLHVVESSSEVAGADADGDIDLFPVHLKKD